MPGNKYKGIVVDGTNSYAVNADWNADTEKYDVDIVITTEDDEQTMSVHVNQTTLESIMAILEDSIYANQSE